MNRESRMTWGWIALLAPVVAATPVPAQQFTQHPATAHICAGEEIGFSATADFQGGANPQFVWQFDGGTGYAPLNNGDRNGRVTIVSNVSNPSAATTTLTISDADADVDWGFYRVRAISGAGQATSQPAGLSFVAPTTVDATSSHTIACVNSSVSLQADVEGKGGEAFLWSVSTGPNLAFTQFTPVPPSIANPTFAPTQAGLYVLQVQAVGGVCGDLATDTVAVQSVPRLAVAPGPTDATTCLQSPIQLSAGATGGSGPRSYVWTIESGPNANPTQFSAIDVVNPVFTPTFVTQVDQPYILRVTAQTTGANVSCASATGTINIHVNNSLTVDASPESSSVCVGDNVGLFATSNDTNADFSWTIDPSSPNTSLSQIVGAGSDIAIFSPSTPGTYTIHISASSGACATASDSVVIEAFEQPSVSIDDPTTGICVGDALSLTAEVGGSDQQSYAWSVTSGPNTSAQQFSSPNQTNTTFEPTAPGTYVLRLSVVDSFCVESVFDVVSLTVYSPVDAAPATESGETVVCVGQPLPLEANGSGGDEIYYYQWSILSGPNLSSAQFSDDAVPPAPNPTTIGTPTFTPTASGNYNLQLVIDGDAPGDGLCESQSAVYFLPISVQDALSMNPAAEFSPTAPHVPTQLSANILGGVEPNVTWSVALLPQGCVDPNPIDGDGVFTANCLGTYRISVLAEDPSCDSATDSFELDVIEFTSEPQASPDVICVGPSGFASAQLNAGILGDLAGAPDLTYEWTIDAQPAGADAELDDESVENPILTVFLFGSYTIGDTDAGPGLPEISADLIITAVDPEDEDPIEFAAHPESATACVGDDATLAVEVTGLGPRYQWRRNSVDLIDETESELVLTDLTLGDTGQYDCVVTSPCDVQIISNTATLAVTPPPDLPPLISVPRLGAELYELNPGCVYDGSLTTVGALAGTVAGATGLATHPSLDQPYADVRISGSSLSWLASIDTESGAATVIGLMRENEIGRRIFDIAFDPDSSPPLLYAIQGNDAGTLSGLLYTVNLATAELTPVANISPFSVGEGHTITIAGGNLYHHVRTAGSGVLRRVSLATGGEPVILRSYTGDEGVEWSAMLYANDLFLAATIAGELWSIDPDANFDPTALGTVDDGAAGALWLAGMAFTDQLICSGDPVSVNQSPNDATVCQFTPVQFTVDASGGDPIAYQWRHNGDNIPGANQSAYSIDSAVPPDAGDYDAVLSNGCGSMTSAAATLTVLQPIPEDFDLDCDTDLADFAVFQGCAAGPSAPIPFGCDAVDLNNDGRIDLLDFAFIQREFTAP